MKPYKRMTKENIATINGLYDFGLSYKEIAAITGYGATTISKYIWKPRKAGRRAQI